MMSHGEKMANFRYPESQQSFLRKNEHVHVLENIVAEFTMCVEPCSPAYKSISAELHSLDMMPAIEKNPAFATCTHTTETQDILYGWI